MTDLSALADVLDAHLGRWERRAYRTPLDHYEAMRLSESDTKLIIAALRRSQQQPTGVVREALEAACKRLQSFLDTFGDIGDCVTQADLDDWRAALTHQARATEASAVRVEATDEQVETAWAAMVGNDVASICHQASVVRGDIKTAISAVLLALTAVSNQERGDRR